MCTDALIEIDGTHATLCDKNDPEKYITLDFMANCDITVGSERALPLPTSPEIPEQNKNIGYYRLFCEAHCDGDFTLTVKINTRNDGNSALGDYHVSIDDWTV